MCQHKKISPVNFVDEKSKNLISVKNLSLKGWIQSPNERTTIQRFLSPGVEFLPERNLSRRTQVVKLFDPCLTPLM